MKKSLRFPSIIYSLILKDLFNYIQDREFKLIEDVMDLPPMDSYYDDLWHKQDIIYEYRKVLLVLYLIIV